MAHYQSSRIGLIDSSGSASAPLGSPRCTGKSLASGPSNIRYPNSRTLIYEQLHLLDGVTNTFTQLSLLITHCSQARMVVVFDS